MFKHLVGRTKAFYKRLFHALFRTAPHPFGKLDEFQFDAGLFFILLFSLWQLVKDVLKPFLTLTAILLLILVIILALVVALAGPIIILITSVPGYFYQQRQLNKRSAGL